VKKTLVISPTHRMVMDELFTTHGDPIGATASLTGLSRSELQRILDDLVAFKYVENMESDYYLLTEKGEAFVMYSRKNRHV
jgi:DNA-binding IclR family transcriptional regulator